MRTTFKQQTRVQDSCSIDRVTIEAEIAAGKEVILQFGKPCYTAELLGKINNLCGELGKDLNVRFYGHKFDASFLRYLPDVASLSVDCLIEATNLNALSDLANLRHLSLGVYKMDDQNFLKSLQLQNLESLNLSETAKANFDLAPLQACGKLAELGLHGHTKNIDCLTSLPKLRQLQIAAISKKQRLDFVSKITGLKRLVIILGGRSDISEIQHSSLEELEILRVLGFSNFDNISAFPSLRFFAVEDQIRLENIRFTSSNKKIQSFRIFNCKTLHGLDGLENLTELEQIRIGTTSLNINSILIQRLPTSLKVFGFYTGKSKENAKIRERLDALGYREFE